MAKTLAILGATLAAYIPALSCGYIWDDDLWLLTRKLDSLSDLAPYWFLPGHFPQYYPLVHTSFFLEEKLWGLSPAGFHAVNILLHGLCAVLIWRVLLRLRVPGAYLCGLLFALHPMCVESVAWVTERKNVLSGVFFFASILGWTHFFGLDGKPSEHRPLWWFAGFALFVCAVLS
ncbi:MAG: O-GlcNAc transferase, partial [Thermodesulfobacteriota bacterium]